MKNKIFLILLLDLICISSCRFNDSLPSKNTIIEASFDDTQTNKVSFFTSIENFNLNDYQIYSISNHYKEIKKFLVGDKLTLYFDDSSTTKINHIYDSRPNCIYAHYQITPGSGSLAFLPNEENIYIANPDIEFYIDKDNCFHPLRKEQPYTGFYCSYREEDCTYVNNSSGTTKVINLLGVYSYNFKYI